MSEALSEKSDISELSESSGTLSEATNPRADEPSKKRSIQPSILPNASPSDSPSESSSTPQWFEQGHLRDDLARQFQPMLRNCTFMYTLRKPQLGMRTESEIGTKDGKRFLMSGMITFVDDDGPTTEALNKSNSLFWRLTSRGIGVASNAQTLDEKRELLARFFGCLHGQRMKSVSRLSRPCPKGLLPITIYDVIEVSYIFDDNMYYPWTVEGLRVLKEQEIQSLPPYFYEYFEGCPCPRCTVRATTGTGSGVVGGLNA